MASSSGVWRNAAFLGMFGDPYLRMTPYEYGGHPQALMGTLDVLSQLFSETVAGADEDPVKFPLSSEQAHFLTQTLVPQLQQCKTWVENGAKLSEASELPPFLEAWKAFLLQLQIEEPTIVPGGFASNTTHTIMYILEKTSEDAYSFTVCNKGPGAELYHPAKPQTTSLASDGNTCDKIRVQSCVQISAIPKHRFLDMAFWTLLLSQWVRKPPSEYHRAETLYDVLLPWLAGDRLLPLAFEEAEQSPAWQSGALGAGHTLQRSNLGFCKSVVEAVRYMCLYKGGFSPEQVKYSLLYKLRYRMYQRIVTDLEVAKEPAKAFPEDILETALKILSSISLLDSVQGRHSIASVSSDAVIGIYFAMSSPCRQFTKKLVTLSEQLRARNKPFVIILVSVDQEHTDFTTLISDLPIHSWLLVPFSEVNARKQLAQVFRVSSMPLLILRDPSTGTILTPKGRELVESDPSGFHYPWNDKMFQLPITTVTLSERICIDMASKQIGLKSLQHHSLKHIDTQGLEHVHGLVEKVDVLLSVLAHGLSTTILEERSASLNETIPFIAFENMGLLRLDGSDDGYAGSAAELDTPVLGNFLEVPERVTSIALAVAAFVRCHGLCESLLRRAADGSSSSRISLHHEVIQLVTSLFVEVLPVPLPSKADLSAPSMCMWCQPVKKELQLRCLNYIYSMLMILGSVWQSMEQPTRQFDSERSLASVCALAIFDRLLRTPASDVPLDISVMMNEDGGCVLAHTLCKANITLQKATSFMEFARPHFGIVRGRVLAYFKQQDALNKYKLFDYHMPEDKIELKKYSTTLIFVRRLMERFGYQLIDPNDPTPRTEMEALMEWFCSDDTPMAKNHPEVALARDMTLAVKFLATMETKEIELMRRRKAQEHWQMWQLSFDDSSASNHRRHFFGMRGLNKILNGTFNWEVVNFRGSDQDIADVDVHGFMERSIFFGEGAVVSSPADLSALLATGANATSNLLQGATEDDIMHSTNLPTFNGTLSTEEAEYLMSYLTVPYARIPLIVSFFSSRDRVTYLFNPMLQNLFRAVLFESGDWVLDELNEEIVQVPLRKSALLLHEEAVERVMDARVQHQKCEEHLGTMNGLLLNELVHAPDAVLLPMLKMLDAIKELGEAAVHSADAKFILFMIKLGVDVLRYLTFTIDSIIQENARTASTLGQYREKLLSYVFGFAHDTLEKWRNEAETINDLQTSCVVHSYLVLLHVSLRREEYTPERVSRMIGSIAFVRNWHCFGMKLSSVDDGNVGGLSAEDRLLRWLQSQGIKTENVGKNSLDKYLTGRPLYLKIGMQTVQAPSIVDLSREGSETILKLPPGNVLEVEIFETIHLHRRRIVKWLNELDSTDRDKVLGQIVRIALRSNEPTNSWQWNEGTDVNSTGRFTCTNTDLKLDIQTGEILWRNDELKPLPDSMTQFADFKSLFGNKSLHCGLVTRQEHRNWVKVIGTDFELIEWDDPTDAMNQGIGAPIVYKAPILSAIESNADGESAELKMYWECPACTCANFNGDKPNALCDVCGTPRIARPPPAPVTHPQGAGPSLSQPAEPGFEYLGEVFSRAFDPYSEVDHPHPDEQWAVDLIGTALRVLYPPEPEDKKLTFSFFLPRDPLPASATRVNLIGHDTGPKEKKAKDKLATFKEIVAYRAHGIMHIYSLITHGRRMYRKLIFTSNSRLSLHSFPLQISPDDGAVELALLRAGGDPRERQMDGGSLVIVRRNHALKGTEQFVPPRLLQGVVPSCLLESFRMWKGEDGTIRGEPVDLKSQWFRYRVEIQHLGTTAAMISRKSIKTSFSRINERISAISSRGRGTAFLPPPPPSPAATASTVQGPIAQRQEVEIRDEDVVQLMAMGFSYAACCLSLRENHNDIGVAAQWLLDENNQIKIVQAEAASESGDLLLSEDDVQEQNLALLMSVMTSPSREACEYALSVFDKDLNLAKAWLEDSGNADEIKRVEYSLRHKNILEFQRDSSDVLMEIDSESETKIDYDEIMEIVEEEDGETLYLLNLLEINKSRYGKDILQMADLLCRVDDLSHILVWCTSPTKDISIHDSLATVAFVELPRLKLKLKPTKNVLTQRVNLEVLDQNGWFVSDLTLSASGRSKYLKELTELAPDCLILESDTKDLKIVCPNHDLYRPSVIGEPFAAFLVTDRASMGWQQAMETRYYSYPIHSSHTFVLPPSLSSTMYLILTSLLTRKYTVAMSFISRCNVDVTFTDEEKWIFDQLAKTVDDRHPNACACRIRLSLAIAYSDNKAPWNLKAELHDYFTTIGHVDAVCKLTLEEEHEGLKKCHQRSSLLSLRKAYCEHTEIGKNFSINKSLLEYQVPRNRAGGQPWMKLRLFSKEYLTAHGKKLSTVRYNRPKYSMGVDNVFLVQDDEAAKLVWNCAPVGDELSGANRGLGFVFLYECLNHQLVVRFASDDCSHSFGDLSARFLHLKLSRWGRETVEDGEEESAPSFAMAQLAMMIAHPDNLWPSSPCDHESTQLLSHGANLYSKMTFGTVVKHFFASGEQDLLDKLQSADHQTRIVQPMKAQFNQLHQIGEGAAKIQVALEELQSDTFEPSNSACRERVLTSVAFSDTTHQMNPEFPLEGINIEQFITFCDPDIRLHGNLPFDLSQHSAAQSVAAKDLLKRLSDDIQANANGVNESKDAFITGVTFMEIGRSDALVESSGAEARIMDIIEACVSLREKDRIIVTASIERIELFGNEIDVATNPGEKNASARFLVERRVGRYPRVTFDFLTSLVSSDAFELDLNSRNPLLRQRLPVDLVEQILTVLVLCNRIVHINRTIQSANALLKNLRSLRSTRNSSSIKQTLQASKELADLLLAKRHYLRRSESTSSPQWFLDPRFLVFEYVFDILLRGRQVQMIDSFVDSLKAGESRVQQMIMGAGKTTVVGPLLTYILADKQHLITHVMPTALLEQSRQVLRSRFSNLVLGKRIFTFEFDRSVADDPNNAIKLFEKLNRARLHGDVVCASPESVKSMMLKFVELLHSLEESSDLIQLPLSSCSQNLRRIRRTLEDRSEMADELHKILELWQQGTLIMDEVDVLLHPLRSELNFPIGNKFPIDLTANRWELPIHLLDAVLATKQAQNGQEMSHVVQLQEVLSEGYTSHALQRFPHLVLLDMDFYDAKMLPILTEIAMQWLNKHFRIGKCDVDEATVKHYLLCARAELHENMKLRESIEHGLSDASIKLLNLSRDWLRTILPHVLSKINRVSYGLLRGDHQTSSGGSNSPSRLLLAVPFIGKDVPSRSSEFAHPDVLIGLTILAYRYEGIRTSDLVRIVSQLKQDFSRQLGPRDARPACAMFREWVTDGLDTAQKLSGKNTGGGVLPLPLFQLRDAAQVARLHVLVAKLASVVYYYVRQHVFPLCMNFQKLKISACGHELGSNSLFANRIGFSGTPSNLLPMDLGECYYEPRSDGSIFQTLTNDRVVSIERKINWTARSILLDIAQANPPVHALIDTGALITGFDNQEVATFLLAHLPQEMEGVVYLDAEDRQMILLRDHNAPMPLVQCGLHPSKRFTFYDQVHTTGMDIKQCVHARAVLTLGKDMTFRDYAQGAYRMRGIETGQSIHLFLIPEVENRIRHEMQLALSPGLVARNLSDFLLLVPAWLLINSMRMESVQLVQLSLQELHNTWRKRALHALMNEIGSDTEAIKKERSLSSRVNRFVGGEKQWLRDCVNRFRIEISYTIENVVPQKRELMDVITALVTANQSFLQTSHELELVERVKQRLAHSNGTQHDDNEQGDLRLTAEVVHENEAEAEEEAEEEAEQEEQKMSAFTRDDEHPIPWNAMVLAEALPQISATDAIEDSSFYPLAQFQAHSECPQIDFPSSLLVSGNYFRRRWVGLGERRLKNVGLVLEWSPLAEQETMKAIVHHLFALVMSENPGMPPNEAVVHALQRASLLPKQASDQIATSLKTAVATVSSQQRVYLVALSLAEGETIRRMIHKNHPAFRISQVRLRTCEGELVESSSFSSSWQKTEDTSAMVREEQLSIGIQCLRFFNNEMYYFPNELELLLRGLESVPLGLRHEFFDCCLRLRRRERHLWGDTPLAKVFTAKDEWHLLGARARMQQFHQSLKRKKKLSHLATALRKFDANGDGQLRGEEIVKCLESFQLGYSSGDLNEIIHLIADVSVWEAKGGIPMETICAAFHVNKSQMNEALAREDAALLAADGATQAKRWPCPVCTFENDWAITNCGACQEPNPFKTTEDATAAGLSGPQEWRCGNCTFINQPADVACAICELDMNGQRAVPRGKWICAGEQGGCTFFNSMSNFYCEVCNRARPDLASTRF